MKYYIWEDEETKMISIYGYYYLREPNDVEDNKEVTYVDVGDCEIPLSEYLSKRKEKENEYWFLNEYKQYLEDMTLEEANDQSEHFFLGGVPGKLLSLKDVNMDTPCGFYRETAEIIN